MSTAVTEKSPDATDKVSSRPSVIALAIKEKAALYGAYIPFIENGGLFIPTQRPANIGDDFFIVLTLMDDPAKAAIPSKVAWITPAGTPGRQQGLGLQFSKTDASVQVRSRIEDMLGSAIKSSRSTHTA